VGGACFNLKRSGLANGCEHRSGVAQAFLLFNVNRIGYLSATTLTAINATQF